MSDRRVRTVLPLLPFDINRDGRADFITPTLGVDETLVDRVAGTPDTYPQYTWGEEGVWISEVLSGIEFQTYPTNASVVRTEYLEAGGGSVPTLITRDDLVLDADGDGALDLLDLERRGHPLGLIPAGGVGRLFHNIRAQAPLIERVVDGMGVVTEVEYRNLSDPAVYTPGTDCQYPQRCVTDSREVVYERRDDDGLGGQRTTRFSYVDGRADLSGRGWLGFARVRSVDLLSGTTSLTDFDNGLWSAMRDGPRIRYPRAHRPLHSLSYTYDASVTDSVVLQGAERYMSYLVTEPGAGRFRVRNDSVVEFAYEGMSAPTNPDAPFVGATMIRQVTTERSHYDVYGFPWVETSDAPGGQTTVETSWDHDAGAWRFGFVQRRTATAATPGLGGCARRVVEEFVNDLPAARVLSATRNPEDPLTTRVTQFGFDSYGNITETLTTAVDEDGESETRVQTVLWDPNGYFPVTVINALGHVTTVAFEPRYGQLRASVDPNWIETRSYVDGFGRPRVAESDRGVRTEARYLPEEDGRFRIEVRSNAGGRAAVETDRLGRTVRAETVHATVTSEVVTAYDARGRVTRVSEPGELGSGGGHPTTYFYDGLDRLRRTVSPEGEEVRFAYEPNRVHRRNAAGAEWTTTTDLLGHVVSATEPHESGAGPVATTGYGRCAAGEPARVIDPGGNVTSVHYDLLGRRIKLSDPDSGGQYFEYDGWDELTATVDGENRRTRFVRDALSRLVARHDEADGALAEWEYDTASLGDRSALGLLAFSSSGDGVTDEFRYDELARPRSVTRRLTDFESRMDLVHHYDEFSRLVGVDYPSITGAGVHVDYQFDDESGEVISVSRDEGGWSTRLWELSGQDVHGLPTKEVVGPASRGTTYRRDGRVASVETGSDEGVLQRLSYGYDERGMLRWRTDSLSARTEVFAHDALGRLFAVREGGHTTESYDYDLLGNLTGSHDASLSYPAGSGVARPHGVTDFDAATGETWTAQYDETGNVTEMGPLHLTWNQRNLPRTASNGGTYASFQYDADGGRALKVAGPEMTVYFGAYEVRRVGMSLIERTVISTPVGPVAQIEVASVGSEREETTRWVFTERQGSVETSWVEGEDPEHFRYDAFGGVLSESGEVSGDAPSDSVSHGYTGHEHDEALGFINMGGRIYHPRLRRFLSTDPLTSGSGQGLNRYSYVRNSPMMLVDPTGYDAAEVAAGNRAAYAEAQAALGWGCIGAVECSAAPSLAEPSGAGDTEASDGAGADRAGGALTGEGVASSAENAFMSGARGMGLAEPINLLAGGAGVATGFLGNVLLVGLAGAGVGLAGPQAVPYLIAVGSVALVVASIYTYQHRTEIWESISRPFSTIAAGEGNPSDFFHAGVTVGTVASLPVAGATFAPTRAAGAQIGEFLLPMAIDMTTTVGESAAAGTVSSGVATLASTGGGGAEAWGWGSRQICLESRLATPHG